MLARLFLFFLLTVPSPLCGQGPASDALDTSLVGVRPVYPEFPGGFEALMKFIADHLQWQESSGPGGKVYVTFTVEEDGSLTETKVLRGVDVLADAEAMRLVNAMPRWNPGRDHNGKPMRQRWNLPIQICTR